MSRDFPADWVASDACAVVFQLCLENQDWASGPPGFRASGPLGLRASGPPGRGPLGRRGPWAMGRWAAGLFLAKPLKNLASYTNPCYTVQITRVISISFKL